jgi:hypothetical protein
MKFFKRILLLSILTLSMSVMAAQEPILVVGHKTLMPMPLSAPLR